MSHVSHAVIFQLFLTDVMFVACCLLYQDAVVDTRGKYALCLIIAFFLGFAGEGLRYFRSCLKARRRHACSRRSGAGGEKSHVVPANGADSKVAEQEEEARGPTTPLLKHLALESLVFGLHMLVAYVIMLLVMTYE